MGLADKQNKVKERDGLKREEEKMATKIFKEITHISLSKDFHHLFHNRSYEFP